MSSTVLYDAPGPRARARHRLFGILTVVGIVVVLGLIVWKLWVEDQFTSEKWEVFYTPRFIGLLARATLDTVWIAALSIAGALVFGVVFGVAKLSDHAAIRWVAWTIVEFFRAVPLLLLIIFVWFYAFETQLGTIAPLVIGLILYNGSVLAETFRAGINAVPRGQVEAAYSIGLRKSAVIRIVQLPQAIKIMTPSIISQCVVALKDTSLGYYILAAGLTTVGRDIWRTFDNRLATALVLALLYIVLNLLLSWLGRWAERHVTGARPAQSLQGNPRVSLAKT